MFGSQALETAIGLSVMFFILATAASTLTESVSRMLRKRSKDLETSLKEMLTARAKSDEEAPEERDSRLDREARDFFTLFKQTSIWQAAEAAAGRSAIRHKRIGPSYLSAKAFADAVHEVLHETQNPELLATVPSLARRLHALQSETQNSFTHVRAGLETWFDETMSRAEGAYRRWASLMLFVVGLSLAIGFNASATVVARELWQDAAVRATVVQAASHLPEGDSDLDSVSKAADHLNTLDLPIGWSAAGREVLTGSWAGALIAGAGWLLTAILVMLGGPFWFDLLTRLVSVRNSGSKPPPAASDPTSAVTALLTPQTTVVAPQTVLGASTPGTPGLAAPEPPRLAEPAPPQAAAAAPAPAAAEPTMDWLRPLVVSAHADLTPGGPADRNQPADPNQPAG